MTKRAVNNTEAEVQVVFNENSTIPIPNGEEVVSVLKNIADNNNTFAVTFDSSAITLVSEYMNVYYVKYVKYCIYTFIAPDIFIYILYFSL